MANSSEDKNGATPRTDAELPKFSAEVTFEGDAHLLGKGTMQPVVSADFARQLERELAEANAWIAAQRQAILGVPSAIEPMTQPLPEEEMCPNCVTPWKCNGPHVPERTSPSHVAPIEEPMRIKPQYEKASVSGAWVKEWQDYADALSQRIVAILLEEQATERSSMEAFTRSLDEEHAWQPDGGMLRFESHPGGEAPHVHTTCKKCGERAWFTEHQWGLLSKGCVTSATYTRPVEQGWQKCAPFDGMKNGDIRGQWFPYSYNQPEIFVMSSGQCWRYVSPAIPEQVSVDRGTP